MLELEDRLGLDSNELGVREGSSPSIPNQL